jgi:hypothetical protein
MSREYQGLAARIKAIAPKAIYMHILNLAIESSCNQIKVVRQA